jgi:hypothetical protein
MASDFASQGTALEEAPDFSGAGISLEEPRFEPPSTPERGWIPVGEETVLTPEQQRSTEDIANRLLLKEHIQRMESPSIGLRESAAEGIRAVTSPQGLAWAGALATVPEVAVPTLFAKTAFEVPEAVREVERARETGNRADYYRAIGNLGQQAGVLYGTSRGTAGMILPRSFDALIQQPAVAPSPTIEPLRPQTTVAEVLGKPPEEPLAGRVAVLQQPIAPVGGPENAIPISSAEAQVRGLPAQPRVNEGIVPAEEGVAGIPPSEQAPGAIAGIRGGAQEAPKPEVPLTDPVGNATEFYSLPRLRALDARNDPRIAAAKKYYGAKTVPDLARLAKARFEEMAKARTNIREPEPYQPPTEAPLAKLSDEDLKANYARYIQETLNYGMRGEVMPKEFMDVGGRLIDEINRRGIEFNPDLDLGKRARPEREPPLTPEEQAAAQGQLEEEVSTAKGAEVKPPQTIADAWNKFDESEEIYTARDLADSVEGLIAEGKAPKSLNRHLSKYRKALEEDREMAGRGDVEPAEEAFLNAVEKAASKPKPPEPAVAPAESLATPSPVAEAKAQEEVTRVAQTEGKRSAKDIKDELIARLEQAVKDAPETFDAASAKKITIEIPGDGTFTVWNSKENLQGLLDRAKRISTSTTQRLKAPETSKGSVDVSDISEQAKSIYGTPENAIKRLESQLASNQEIDPRTRTLTELAIERLREETDQFKHDKAIKDLQDSIAESESKIKIGEEGKQVMLRTYGNRSRFSRREDVHWDQLEAGIKRATELLKAQRAALDKLQVAPPPETPAVPPPGPPIKPGPGAASPSEFAERTAKGAGAQPPIEPPQVTIDAGATPSPEVARRAKDFNLFNNLNTGQWSFYFGKLGTVAKAAWDKMALAAFNIRESIGRDVKRYADDLLSNLPRPIRAKGGKVFFDALDGKPIGQIESEWTGKPHGDAVIAAAKEVKARLEEIRVTIRDAKREAYHGFLMGLDRDTLSQLFDKNISREIDTSKYSKEMFSDALTRAELPDDWGIADGSYLTHLFTGNWKITATRGETPEFITRAKTVAEAKAKVFKYVKDNPDYANADWKIEQDTAIPADMIRLGDRRFWHLVKQMKDNLGVTASEVKQAQQGIIGRKSSKQKWFGSLQQRKGFQGYSHDYRQTMTSYLSGFHRWLELSKLQREVQPMIEEVRREGRTSAAEQLDILMDNLWGKPAQSTVLFDNALREIPGVRDYIKPMALERWSRNIKSMLAFLTLRTARFAVVNRLQPLQGLYPLVGERILAQAKIRQHTAEGRALLDEAGVRFDPGQYGTAGTTISKFKNLGERFSGERSNQELAFLAMYQHGTESGLPHAEAINYAKLRGQLLTQFTPIVPDIPPIMRGPISSLLFQFTRFPIKQTELLFKMVAQRQFGGIARWLGVMAATGGLSYFMRQFLFPPDKREKLRRSITNQHGQAVADAVMYGLPGLLNTDLSGSLVLGDEPFGSNIYERIGRKVTGPAASMTAETIRNALTSPRESTTTAQKVVDTLRRFPTLKPIAELIALEQSDLDVRTPDGETKYRKAVKDALAGIGSFRSASESNMQSAVNAIVELKRQTSELKNAAYVALTTPGGNTESALGAIHDFNARWPEVAISSKELNEYIHARAKGAHRTDYERLAGRKFAPLLPSQP